MANTETTLTSAKAWAPDQNAFNPGDVVPDALILKHSNVAGVIDGDQPVLRVAWVSDDEAKVKVEGTDLDEANPDMAEVLIHTAKITQLVRLSNEQYRQAGTAGELAQSVQRAIVKKANLLFVAQAAPVGPAVAPAAGILNVAGIIDGGAVSTNLDGLIDLVAELESNGATPTGIILDPLAWSSLRKTKTGTGSEVGILGAGTNDSERMLLDLPVTVSNAMPANSGLVIDRNAVVSAVGPIMVKVDESVYFNSDSVGLRAVWRIGQNIVRPDRIGRFVVASAGSMAPVWELTLSGTPTGGTYTLTVNGATTTALAYNADATAVAAAINALTGISGVTVSGTSTKTVTFGLAALLSADGSALTGGTDPAANVVHA